MLNFCTGKYTIEEICYLYGETYNLTNEKAIRETSKIINSYKNLIDSYNKPNSDLDYYYNPKIFLFNMSEEEIAYQREHNFLSGLNLSLTLLCNFNCRYCYQTINKSNEKLNLKTCLALVDEASKLGMIYFGITGGEPTLFEGWLTIIKYIIEKEMIPVFTSNGSIIGKDPDIAKKLFSLGLKEITISLDASNPVLHHSITRTSNSFSNVIKAIKYLLDSDIRVIIKYVLSTLNVHDLEKFIDFVVNLGVHEIGITNMEGGAIGSAANSISSINKSQYKKTIKLLNEKVIQYEDKTIINLPDHSSCLYGENDWFPCGGLTMGMSIDPNGDVTICDKLFGIDEFTYGNIFDDTIENIWDSTKLKVIRKNVMNRSFVGDDCAKCDKLNKCKTSCFIESFNKYGSYYSKHPRCKGPFNNDKLVNYTQGNQVGIQNMLIKASS